MVHRWEQTQGGPPVHRLDWLAQFSGGSEAHLCPHALEELPRFLSALTAFELSWGSQGKSAQEGEGACWKNSLEG